jgi:hypothetical protein
MCGYSILEMVDERGEKKSSTIWSGAKLSCAIAKTRLIVRCSRHGTARRWWWLLAAGYFDSINQSINQPTNRPINHFVN